MISTTAKPAEGLGLNFRAIEQGGDRRSSRPGMYVTKRTHEALLAFCWYQRISQSDFLSQLLIARLEQLQESGQLTPEIIDLYRRATAPK